MSLLKTADRILKDLYVHLASEVRAVRLRQLGWFDFRNQDHPATADPVTMAHSVFFYLSIQEDGDWNRATDVLTAILAYLTEATGYQTDEVGLRKLATLLQEHPVRSQAAQDWFDQTFR